MLAVHLFGGVGYTPHPSKGGVYLVHPDRGVQEKIIKRETSICSQHIFI